MMASVAVYVCVRVCDDGICCCVCVCRVLATMILVCIFYHKRYVEALEWTPLHCLFHTVKQHC